MFQNLIENTPMHIRFPQKDGKWLIIRLVHNGYALRYDSWVSEDSYGGSTTTQNQANEA